MDSTANETGLYISGLSHRSIINDLFATISDRPIPIGAVSVQGDVLSIDLARAWRETGLEPSWNNEVSVTVLIS